ncbi:sensor histidine kinase [Desulfopila inferna]|uniref:sensor histidine kinase n=1 Tax=Desulfopila inferna TaxID=468528 RepID=UPI001963FB00|nr:histidine kinase dimerization/phosphoacceptor domain -containing protein [Desulfopila inferna]MBM9605105.1 hypothetical protein [Desulfopila inferna]
MPHRSGQNDKFDQLRRQAEILIRGQPEKTTPAVPDILSLIHELRLYQAELEIQNEELQSAQQEISELQIKFENLYEYAPCGYLTLDAQGFISEINSTGTRLLNTKKSILTHSTFSRFIEKGWEHAFLAARQRAVMSREKQSTELPLARKEEIPLWVQAEIEAHQKPGGEELQWRIILIDISARKAAEISLEEKEVMLKEIHHRVKNNMQVISSLISLQSDELPEGAAREVFQNIHHRVRSMALVHEKLYQSDDLARIQFDDYVRSLVSYLLQAHQTTTKIRLELDLEPVQLPVNTALPCGLILNELVCNALEHAFNGGEGLVRISLHPDSLERARLSVSDNGKGMPQELNWKETDTLGLRLVRMLAGQIHAEVHICSENGTTFTIKF